MDFEIIEFEKAYVQRYQEYDDLFSKPDRSIPCSELKQFWASYLGDCGELCSLSAIWKISRQKCHEFNSYFPRFVDVVIQKVHYESLTVDVNVLIANHRENVYLQNIPRTVYFVPLLEIYLAKPQDDGAGDSREIYRLAERLDQFRMFYSYLWLPWEEELDSNRHNNMNEWMADNLDGRLGLFYDLTEGSLTEKSRKIVTYLIEKGRRIDFQIEALGKAHEGQTENSMRNFMRIVQPLWSELEKIKHKLRHWMKSDTRTLLNTRESPVSGSDCYIVFPKSYTFGELAEYVHRVAQECRPNSRFKEAVSTLNDLSSSYTTGDQIFVCPGKHIAHNERFNFNLHLKGFKECTKPVVTENLSNWYFFKTTANNILFENLVVELRTCGVAVFVKEGLLEMKNVILRNKNDRMSNAIVVGTNATLLANRCEFAGFGTAIICLPGSTVQLNDCSFDNNNISVQIVDGAQFHADNCDMTSSIKIPFSYLGKTATQHYEPLKYLENFELIHIKSVAVKDSTKSVEFNFIRESDD